MRREILDLTMHIHHETDAAIRASDTGEDKDAVWLPKSQIEIERKGSGPTAVITLPEWLAMDKGLI